MVGYQGGGGVTRLVPPMVFAAAGQQGLARTACMYANRHADDHDHQVCVRDDVSYAADLLWTLAVTVAAGDEDRALDALSDCLAAARRDATPDRPARSGP